MWAFLCRAGARVLGVEGILNGTITIFAELSGATTENPSMGSMAFFPY